MQKSLFKNNKPFLLTRANNFNISEYLKNFFLSRSTKVELFDIQGKKYPKFINEFWTSKQRQANSLHEIAYRACFKAELPGFFIKTLTIPGDIVYDPFSGRGTTVIEAALLGRKIIANDINPISTILSSSRLSPPNLDDLEKRLYSIPFSNNKFLSKLSAFYHPDTEKEILSIKKYLDKRKKNNKEDDLDQWIRMVATNRLTGHSKGYFSVYTLPPNQAVSLESQKKINVKRNQKPEYRDTRKIIIKKTQALIKDINYELANDLKKIKKTSKFLQEDSRHTPQIDNNSVQLVVTSPPFLDTIQYADDNWLRCWFNSIDSKKIAQKITMSKKLEDWKNIMTDTLRELYRITKKGGFVAFEVGEIRNGKIKLDEEILPLALKVGFNCVCVIINEQVFTKTSNIWGVSNNTKGTNSNRIVLLTK
jgi:hypothetical protein